MKSMLIITIMLIGVLIPINAYGFALDKPSYEKGDTIIFSGSLEPGKFYTYQVFNPPEDNFAHFNMIQPNSDGTFSDSFKADGQYWNLEGTYTLKLFDGPTILVEIPFQFLISEPEPETTPEPEQTPETTSEPEQTPEPETIPEPEPQLETETESESIQMTTQEPKTHIPGFPALDKSPQYYIDRYENEPSYQDWFDSQFSGKTIYQVLGFPDPVAVPDWIKNNAQWWSTGKINDDDFVSGIEFMIENNIITIPNLPDSQTSSDDTVPSWVRNNANWWALDQISEKEFINAIKYLVEKGIIVV